MAQKRKQFWINRVGAERLWMDEHGGCEAAYVERYGSKDDPKHYGNGGEAIYKADKDALDSAVSMARFLGALV